MTAVLASAEWKIDVAQILVAVATLSGLVITWKIRREQKPNGGNSQRDVINRTEKSTDEWGSAIVARLDTMQSVLADQGAAIKRSSTTIDRLEQRIDHLNDRRP